MTQLRAWTRLKEQGMPFSPTTAIGVINNLMQPVIVHLAKIVLMPDSKSRELYMNDVMNWLVQMQSHNRRVTTKRGIPTHTLVSLWEVLVDSIHNQATLLRTSGFKGVKID